MYAGCPQGPRRRHARHFVGALRHRQRRLRPLHELFGAAQALGATVGRGERRLAPAAVPPDHHAPRVPLAASHVYASPFLFDVTLAVAVVPWVLGLWAAVCSLERPHQIGPENVKSRIFHTLLRVPSTARSLRITAHHCPSPPSPPVSAVHACHHMFMPVTTEHHPPPPITTRNRQPPPVTASRRLSTLVDTQHRLNRQRGTHTYTL